MVLNTGVLLFEWKSKNNKTDNTVAGGSTVCLPIYLSTYQPTCLPPCHKEPLKPI